MQTRFITRLPLTCTSAGRQRYVTGLGSRLGVVKPNFKFVAGAVCDSSAEEHNHDVSSALDLVISRSRRSVCSCKLETRPPCRHCAIKSSAFQRLVPPLTLPLVAINWIPQVPGRLYRCS
jgi:hypothetical protein